MSKISKISKLIREIGEFQKEQNEIEHELSKRVKEAERKIARKQGAINRRAKLIKEKGDFPDGEVIFYTSPWATSIKDEGKAIEDFEKCELGDLISTKVEKKPKKNDIQKIILYPQKHPAESERLSDIEGVGLTRRKEIRITPRETGITVIRVVKTIKKFLP